MTNFDELKREFIYYMEEKHREFLFPKKFFGCMMAIFVEQEPTTQDRIEELTNYSKTTISQMLKLMQVNFPIKVIKKSGIRKKYYTIDMNPREFTLVFFTRIIDSYKGKIDFLLPIIEELELQSKKHPRFDTFKQFLKDYYYHSSLYIRILTETDEELRKMVNKGQIESSVLSSYNILNSPAHQKKIQALLGPSTENETSISQKIEDPNLAAVYDQIKEKFFQKFRENLTSSGSQQSIARAVIGTELLLEQRPLTQEEIEKATKFQRSTISDTLKLLLAIKMIEVVKRPGDRKKYYKILQSWDARTIQRFRVNTFYAAEVKNQVNDWIGKLGTKELIEKDSFVPFLQEIHHSYAQFEQYFRLLEVKYLNLRVVGSE